MDHLSKMAVFQVILVAFFAMSWWDCAQSLEIEVQTDTETKSLIVNCSFDKPSSTTMAVLAIHIIKPSSQGEEESQDQVSDDKKKSSQLEDALATLRIGETKPKVKDDSEMGRFSVEGYINSSYPSACFLELNISNISAADAGQYQCRAEVLDSSFSFRTDWAETNVTVSAAEDEPQDVQWVAQIAELRDRLEAEEQNEALLKGKVETLQREYDELSGSVESLENQTSILNQTVHDIAEGYKSLLQLISGKKDINKPEKTTTLTTETSHEQEESSSEHVNSEAVEPAGQEKEASSQAEANSFIVVPPGANEGGPARVTRRCFVCGDPEANRPCKGEDLAASSPTECPTGKDYCMNEITQTMDSNVIYKSCASKDECVDKDNSESSSCHPFFPIWFGTAARQCTFCCHGDACNNEFKPTRDLFKTGAETKPDTAH